MTKTLLRAFVLMTVMLSCVNTFAQRTFKAGEKLYFNAAAVSWWQNDNATQQLALVNVDDESQNWYFTGEKADEDGNYVFTIGEDCTFTAVRFARLNPENGECWNATDNIPLAGTEGKNYVKTFDQNSTVATWGNYGDAPDPDVTRTIYIVDQTGWDALAIYAWGAKEIFGGWPGIVVTDQEKVSDNKYEYYKFTASGQEFGSYNLIANNNDAGNQFDMLAVSLEKDLAFIVKADNSYEAIPVPEHTTGISTVTTTSDAVAYNLQGMKVSAPAKGLYIMNGKKYVVK